MESEKSEPSSQDKSETTKLVVLGLFIGLVLGGAIGYLYSSTKGSSGTFGLSIDEVASLTEDFVNTNLLPPGVTATIGGADEIGGVYRFNFTINDGGVSTIIPTYVTKDATLFFTDTPIEMTVPFHPPSPPSQQQPEEGDIDMLTLVDDDPTAGNPHAKVIVVEFSDFQCPFCANALPTVTQLKEDYGNQILFVYRDFPLHQIHPLAGKASEAAQCAFEQDMFWEYHDTLFEKQQEWSNAGVPKFKEYAGELGLDTTEFNGCLDSGKYADEVEADLQAGSHAGVSGTPTFIINGQKISGAVPLDVLKEIIDTELAKAG
jgi:protein-disulfide isomerase